MDVGFYGGYSALVLMFYTHLKPPLNGVNRRSGPLPQGGRASLPRMRRHCRSHVTWSHEFIHALCDSSHLSSFVVCSLRCLLAYLCDGSPSPIGARHPLLKRRPMAAPPRGRGCRQGHGQSQRQAAPGRQTPEVEDHNLPQSLDALLALVRSEVERASGQQAPATQGNNSAADGALPAANTDSATLTQIQQGHSMRTQTSTQGTW